VLGSAFVLGCAAAREIRLETEAGVIPVTLEREGASIVFGRMQQPIPNWKAVRAAESCSNYSRPLTLPIETYDLGPHHVFLELGTETEVAALEPDFGAIAV